ncbi:MULTISPECIES: hypothetical protein [Gammaproteobacteria]|uniref:hypothetical protein n=1 Tax=Gammaproteobacteria TaxID=1236 RepID=UPI003566E0FA
MHKIEVECQNDDCAEYFGVDLESEDCGEGTTHVATCYMCGHKTQFDIEYSGPQAGNEKAV